MWHSSYGMDTSIETPRTGDKAGAIFCRTDFSEVPEVDAIWVHHRMQNITNDITIPYGREIEIEGQFCYTTFNSGVDINVSGTLVANQAYFTKYGNDDWSGINILSGGTMDVIGQCRIEYATTGIDIYDTNGLSTDGATFYISNCSNAGIHIHNCDPEIEVIYISGVAAGYGGILVEGSSSDPVLHDITITSCGKGIQIGNYADSDVYLCKIYSNTDHSIYMGAAAHLYMDEDGGYGHNTIDPATDKKAIYNTATNGYIYAENNYWGATPSDDYFGYPAYVFYDPYLTGAYPGVGAGKAVSNLASNQFTEAYQYEQAGNWSYAIDKYREIITESSVNQEKRRAIKSLIRVQDKSGQNYDLVRDIIDDELDTTTTEGYYRAVLDNILCELNVREGNIGNAIEMFSEKAELYSGTSMEGEMLARIAELYGIELGDKEKSKKYADLAASVNPGQLSLCSAYKAAGEEYNPALYEDVFAGAIENFGIESEPIEKTTEEETTPTVSISPNPANPRTTIAYSINEASFVKLEVFNVAGQKVATLVDGYMTAGAHSATFDGANLSSGVYLYNFESRGFRKNGKLLIVR